ncbi:undecaprenyl-diphosphate phosphatase [Horticoccus luteus]|uniref:Undecaprenyl-diphosphatase n=1 Tax=Horticoccus luteus TaxID=2862869 RepID=A0A8F9TXX9_9BACT|nr:undecaprenyl-diphosphate phosphatase [Horticoccus luteus]QYM80180.1 undecaprenyl-diphosphate phosphatase [Horticoccus luteus]
MAKAETHTTVRRFLFALFFLSVIAAARAATPAPATSAQRGPAVPASAAAAELSAGDAVILGVIEGVTEFLPISSTGHLIIATHALHLDSEHPLRDAAGQPLWHKKPSVKDPAGVPLTLKLAADTYTVVIQAGAIIAVVLLYWRPILSVFSGLLGRDPAGLRLFRNLVCAFVPVAIIGLALNHWIDVHLFSVGAVIAAQIAGAILMLVIEAWRRRQPAHPEREPVDLTPRQATGIGFMQCLALWPGTSRSMVTIVGGYLAGLSPARAAEFSFLVGLPVLTGAAFVKGAKSGAAMIQVFGWSHVLLGIAVAAVAAAIAVKFLVSFLSRHGLAVFAYYRIALALVLAWFSLR